nr:cytadherence high molecular weight protein 2-like [Nerophis lumbriciformis]
MAQMDNKQRKEQQRNTDMKTQPELLKRQTTRICHEKHDSERVWKRAQGGEHEIEFLRTKIWKQHEEIERLKSENYDQTLCIKTLRLQMEYFAKKVKESVKTAVKEKMFLQNSLTLINKTTQLLGTQHSAIKTKQSRLESIIPNCRKQSQKHKGVLKEPKPQRQQWLIENLVKNSKQTVILTKQTKEQLEINMGYFKQELHRHEENVLYLKDQTKHINNKMIMIVNLMKQLWPQLQTHTKTKTAIFTGFKQRTINERTKFFKSFVLENREQIFGNIMKDTVDKGKAIEERLKMYPIHKVTAKMYRLLSKVKQVRKNMHTEKKQSAKDIAEERKKNKRMKYKTQKINRELDQRRERIMQERDELEILKLKVYKQLDTLEDKGLMQTMAVMNTPHCCKAEEVHLQKMTRISDETITTQNIAWKFRSSSIKNPSSAIPYELKEDMCKTNKDSFNKITNKVEQDDMPVNWNEMDDKTGIVRDLITEEDHINNEIHKLMEQEQQLQKTINQSIGGMGTFYCEINKIIMEINHLQGHMQKTKNKAQNLINTDPREEKSVAQKENKEKSKKIYILKGFETKLRRQGLEFQSCSIEKRDDPNVSNNLGQTQATKSIRKENDKKREESKSAKIKNTTDVEKLHTSKTNSEIERILHVKDKKTMRKLQSEKKVLQYPFRTCIQSMERVADDLKTKFKKKLEDVDKKVVIIEERIKSMPKMLLELKHMLEECNQGRDHILINNELILEGKIWLNNLLSNMMTETEKIKHLKTNLLGEKQDLDKLKNDVKQEKEYMSKANRLMSKDKLELNLIKSDMQKQLITLKEKESLIKQRYIDLEIKEQEVIKNTTGLETIGEKLKKGIEQIHQLNIDIMSKTEEVNDNRCAMEQQNRDLYVNRQEHCQRSKEFEFARTRISAELEKLLKMQRINA